jgi:hypothetical protein
MELVDCTVSLQAISTVHSCVVCLTNLFNKFRLRFPRTLRNYEVYFPC